MSLDRYARLVRLAGANSDMIEDGVDFDEYLWSNLYEYGQGDVPEPQAIVEITNLAARSPEGYGSVELAFLARLTDDRWVACVAWADSTGFGCREQVDWTIKATRQEAIDFGLDQESRNWLGLSLSKGGTA